MTGEINKTTSKLKVAHVSLVKTQQKSKSILQDYLSLNFQRKSGLAS